MSRFKAGVKGVGKGKGKGKGKPKSVKEKRKVRAGLERRGDGGLHRGDKVEVSGDSERERGGARKRIVVDLTSSSPPPPIKKSSPPPPSTLIATPPKQKPNPKLKPKPTPKLALSSLSTSERSPGIHSPITRSLSLSLSLAKPPSPTGVLNISTRQSTTTTTSTQPPEYYIQPQHILSITPGTIVWLPAKQHIVQNAYVDPKLHINAFDHPAVIVSMPNPANAFSVVEIAIMTTLGSRTLHQTKQLPHRPLLFRVRTTQLPCAKVDVTLRDGRGMRGKYSFVNCRESWRVQIGTLGFYKGGREGSVGTGTGNAKEVDWLRLTSQSLEKLRASIGSGKGLWG
ncbi:hypothetical protein EAE96_010993 [Botrytis aclada]|nr:hypothetical protein EAE96_010993 [Botrytis aclada]